EDDEHCPTIAKQTTKPKHIWGYTTPDYVIEDHIYKIIVENKKIPLQVFGKHNLQNINAARLACNSVGISDDDFYAAIQTFKGASKRLECVYESATCCMYKDFAHSPSKLKATIDAVKEKFNDRKLVACIELHTFSSLTADFLKHYANTMDNADYAFVYFNPNTLQHKKLPPIENKMISAAFENENIQVYQHSKDLINKLLSMKWENQNLLMMSSGNFDGIDYDKLAAWIFEK
ncbi:MAG: peptidoglycan synthetase, partial [Bacteroidales bacterium]|nr:peptidoglycan synthetase [Bacteroidales bacterium]